MNDLQKKTIENIHVGDTIIVPPEIVKGKLGEVALVKAKVQRFYPAFMFVVDNNNNNFSIPYVEAVKVRVVQKHKPDADAIDSLFSIFDE